MKKLMLWIIALAASSGGALLAQSLTGTWQGSLQVPQAPGGQLRIVIKISTTDADTFKAVMYSIDQGGQPIAGRQSHPAGFDSEDGGRRNRRRL